jgi:hypothetical protein
MSKRSRKSQPREVHQQQQPAAADREHVESLLDRALADTFPASDPVSTLVPDPSPLRPSSDVRSPK